METSRKSKVRRWLREHGPGFLFVTPGVVFVSFFIFYPIGYQIFMSFFERSSWSRFSERGTFVGLENYRQVLFEDPRFWHALQNNLVYTCVYVGGVVGLGLLLALLINQRIRGWKLFRFIYYLPVMIMVPVTAVLWGSIYNPVFGPLNVVLRAIGLGGLARPWLGQTGNVLYSIAVVFIWQFAGWPMIVFLAAMSNIPQDIYDAAVIDGCSVWQTARYVTLPMIKYILTVVLVLQIIWSLKVFEAIWILTRGGPGNSSEVVSVYLFYKAFFSYQMGYASAISIISASFILVITIIYVKFFGSPSFEY